MGSIISCMTSTNSIIASFNNDLFNFNLIYQSIKKQYYVADDDIFIGYSIPFGEPFTADSHKIAIEIFNDMMKQFV